jgi:hypothetical protein
MSLNMVLGLVLLQDTKKSASLADFRDSVADTRPAPAAMENALAGAVPAAAAITAPAPAAAIAAPVAQVAPAELAPVAPAVVPPVAEAPAADEPAAAPEVAPAPAKPARSVLVVANDWEGYKKDAAGDRDVIISNIFHSEKTGKIAMRSAVNKQRARGREVLFSCLLPATGGGMFYMIRLAQTTPDVPRVASAQSTNIYDYSNQMQSIMEKTEKEVQETF